MGLPFRILQAAETVGLWLAAPEIIRFGHGSTSSKKRYSSSFIPRLHDVCFVLKRKVDLSHAVTTKKALTVLSTPWHEVLAFHLPNRPLHATFLASTGCLQLSRFVCNAPPLAIPGVLFSTIFCSLFDVCNSL